jgi:hypothetical protein
MVILHVLNYIIVGSVSQKPKPILGQAVRMRHHTNPFSFEKPLEPLCSDEVLLRNLGTILY